MKRTHTALLCACVLASLLTPLHASANDSVSPKVGPFVGLSIGGAGISTDAIGVARTGETEHGHGAAKLTAGYWFSKHWGVAASYVDLGEFTQTYSSGSFSGSAQSVGLGLLTRLPINDRWSVVGKATLTHNETKQESVTGDGAQFRQLSGHSTNLVLPGLEVNYRVTDSATVFFEAESRGAIAEKANAAYAGVGLRWHF
ncbi:MAG: outer membrane beta-barrel protein [Burkholderiaceae bacterium]